MGQLLSIVTSLLTGKAGEQIGGTVAWIAQVGALLAALAPLALWLQGHKDEVFVSLTYGELAFWSAIVGPLLIIIIRLVHRAPPP
jgi:hypothetical protein